MTNLGQASSHPQRRVVVISDNARYRPELNPIERVWKLTRRLCLHNRYFEALDDVTTAVEDQFNKWTDANDTLRRLCATI